MILKSAVAITTVRRRPNISAAHPATNAPINCPANCGRNDHADLLRRELPGPGDRRQREADRQQINCVEERGDAEDQTDTNMPGRDRQAVKPRRNKLRCGRGSLSMGLIHCGASLFLKILLTSGSSYTTVLTS
jgi:hypothetical protein